ncbi:HTH-type transcriptional repressor ComR [compost metagenome]|jgi:AcrR family transcriptional regulator|uniref:TetR/AcrR family transcriptional regulator n=1 Tax=Paenibacillus rhizolycopersici TaxID=2780073 RepID=A0ABS2HAP7_9BACL|nr:MULTISPECIES: TetR/AcrR family transcriptional regulator [Paenibacillus]MBM6996879.1 TetR/AcrR family transcriptional regulator [Paenibacillus rhizolycopersici]MUG88807.1 TetR family transcriptional regulator [Paenibacillus timonensis]GIP50040.1 TetR family transcriptional regulator [Paenibacillus sp. J53TS2]
MGRHREFNVDQALDAALCVFWQKGYEGTSYTDLTQATGVERPALYSAFGNKEALFRRVLERYYEHYHDFFPTAMELPTSREVVAHIFRSAADLQTRYPDHKGCLYVHGDLAGSDEAEPIRLSLIDARAEGETMLRDRLERAKQEGDLPETANCAVLAAFVMAVLHGMAVQAKAGFSRDMLEAVAEQALSTWPTGGTTLTNKSS